MSESVPASRRGTKHMKTGVGYQKSKKVIITSWCIFLAHAEGRHATFITRTKSSFLMASPPSYTSLQSRIEHDVLLSLRGGNLWQNSNESSKDDEEEMLESQKSSSNVKESMVQQPQISNDNNTNDSVGEKDGDDETLEKGDKLATTSGARKEDGETNTETKGQTHSSDDDDGVDVPSLDTFINYDESTADALSSMSPVLEAKNNNLSSTAPILETTTTHILDTVMPHDEKSTDNNNVFEASSFQQNVNVDGASREKLSSKVDDTESESSEKELPDGEETSDDVDTIMEELTFEEAQEKSATIRLEGKQLHDDADYQEAAVAFSQAALLLEKFLDESMECADDWSTCRLHEALCCLKADDSETAVDACTRVLDRPSTSGAVRARALYRRAKAYIGLQQSDLALQDARGAAFLGDRRGVALYGQLMRESPGLSSSSSLTSGSSSAMDDLASSSALFESLLSKSGTGSQAAEESAFPQFNPLSLLSGMDGGGLAMGGKGMDTGGLAKSVITSLSKRLEDEGTQDTICKYLQTTSGPQIQQYAGMAGMELPESQATRIANFLRRVTPNSIRKTVKTGKRLLYGVQLMRKTSKVVTKYRNILIWVCLLGWAKSAVSRPLPVNKRIARLAAKGGGK